MKRQTRKRLRRCEQLEPRLVLDSTVVFSEIMYNPAGSDSTGNGSVEWVELHNQMAVKMDLSGWTLADGVRYRIPDGTTIDGGDYLVIASDPAALQASSGVTALGPFDGSLSNSGERLVLRERSGREMNAVEYSDHGDWPAAADGSGASLAKRDRNANSSDADNWTFSPQIGGTPGAPNFSEATEPATVAQVIAPDDVWRFDDSNSNLGTAWRELGFDDTDWSAGQGVFYASGGNLGVSAPQLVSVSSVMATTAWQNRVPENLVNGSGLIGDIHDTNVDNMWLTNNDSGPEVTFDFGSVQSLQQMRVWNYAEYRPDLPTRIGELLGRSVRDASISISADGANFTLFADTTFTEITAANSTEDFSDTFDMTGISARYVRIDIHSNYAGKDYNDPASNDGFGNFTGLSEVQFFTDGDDRVTELSPAETHYFRKTFAVTGPPDRTELLLNSAFDDGAVFYVNGQEVRRANMPSGAIDFDTAASVEVADASYSGALAIPDGGLVQGTNVLAVEVHQRTDNDMVFHAELTAIVSPFDSSSLTKSVAFNEVAGANADSFQIEIVNYGDVRVEIGGMVVRSTSGDEYTLPAGALASGQYLTIDAAQLGFAPSSSETVFLLDRSGSDLVLDGIDIRTSHQARVIDGTGQWLRPVVLTPGAANRFALEDAIVINEIMYHHRPDFATAEIPGTFENTIVLPLNANWKYNRSGNDLGANWFQTDFTVDGVNWRNGVGLIGVETSALPAPLETTWEDFDRSIVRYYFQTEFEFDGVSQGADIILQHVIDDGAVFYLNGQEIVAADGSSTRFNLGPGNVDNTTLASPGVSNAILRDPIAISVEDLIVGTNVLSVEVHQSSTGSNDMVFGLQLSLREPILPVVPGTDFAPNGEEWIELYNRGNTVVDLTGWTLDDAVQFNFADGTTLGPDEYLVVARDVTALAAKYPALRIAGQYRGTLGDSTDRILLTDRWGNPADVVEYFDDGRWPLAADGGGASLELRDPLADNSIAESWAASNEANASTWQTYTYTGIAERSAVGNDSQWQEFIFGLLDWGEVLIDDVTVIEQPSVPGPQLIGNSTFENDTAGGTAAGWRFIGNHRHSEVIADLDDPANQVLRLVATGATEHMHNHVNTTLSSPIVNGREYTISYRAKWISGSPQLHSRLYFNRLAKATTVQQPTAHGTPGAPNSRFVDNVGPTYAGLQHVPAVPQPNQPMTVSVTATDPQGVTALTLWYAVQGGTWQNVAMESNRGDRFTGVIPGQSAGAIIQFYVEGTDASPARVASHFPAQGRLSRALVQVDDDRASDTGIHNLRIILTPDDADWLHTDINLMSNDRVGATVVYNETEIYYDVGVRLSGSQRARPFQPRLSFNVQFNQDQLFRGVHQSMALDRSDSTGFGQREILLHHAMGQVGGLPAEYNDLVHIITPRNEHTGGAEMQLARYTNVFLDSQYNNGGDGRLFEYELVYYPTAADAQGFKFPQPDGVVGTAIRSLGDDKESYRWTYLVKNNRDADDFDRIIDWAQVMGTSGATFNSAIGGVIDVDQWLRSTSFAAASGFGDQFGAGSQHNAQFFVNPNTQLVEYFPHDLDAFFDASNTILPGNEIAKVVNASPTNQHYYYGYMHHFVTTIYNRDYMSQFAADFSELLPLQGWSSWLSAIGSRQTNVLNQINNRVVPVAFEITTPGPISVGDQTTVTIGGKGWVNVNELRLSGAGQPLAVRWITASSWEATIPVDRDTTQLSIEAYDFGGSRIGTATIGVMSTATNPVVDNLRISEVNYNPAAPSAAELVLLPGADNDDFEFIEFVNIGDESIHLLGVTFTDGVNFAAGDESLAPDERAVVVKNINAFRVRYGEAPRVLGEFFNSGLSNSGERLKLTDGQGSVIAEFAYLTSDPWPVVADGAGASLQAVQSGIDVTRPEKHYYWEASTQFGGSPGSANDVAVGVVITEVLANTNRSAGEFDAIELYNDSRTAIDIGGWYLSDSAAELRKFRIPTGTILAANATIAFDERHFNPTPQSPGPRDFALSGTNGDDVYLTAVGPSGETRFVDEIHFAASRAGESWGRLVPNPTGRSVHESRPIPLTRSSIGCQRPGIQHARVGSLLITELQYNPGEPTAADLVIAPNLMEDDLEFVEIFNSGSSAVDLSEWRLRGGVDLNFDAGTTIGAHEIIVLISFDPNLPENAARAAAFRSHYANTTARLVGGWAGQLSDSGEEIRLLSPSQTGPDSTTGVTYFTEDAILYDDTAYGGWTPAADGTGRSLARKLPTVSAHLARSWADEIPSPGVETSDPIIGDLDGDRVFSSSDIDLMWDAIRDGSSSVFYDADASGSVDRSDISQLLSRNGLRWGDADFSAIVDPVDLNRVGLHWLQAGCLGWADGDFDGNNRVDVHDLNQIGLNWLIVGVGAPIEPQAARTPHAVLPVKANVAVVDRAFIDITFINNLATVNQTVEQSDESIATAAAEIDVATDFIARSDDRRFYNPRMRRIARRLTEL